jgi:hypothetical protein
MFLLHNGLSTCEEIVKGFNEKHERASRSFNEKQRSASGSDGFKEKFNEKIKE